MAETKLTTRVSETTSTTGTGTLDLNGAQTGYRAFSDELTSADETWYLIVDSATSPTLYEVGRGVFTTGSPNTLSRDAVVASSNAGNKVSLPVGTAIVSGSPAKEFISRLSAITTQSVTLDDQASDPSTGANQIAAYNKDGVLTLRAANDGAITTAGSPTRLANAESLGTGSSYTKTGIPSWATHIAITIRDLSTDGGVVPALRLGTSGGLAASGYVGSAVFILNAANPELTAGTTGFLLGSSWAAGVVVSGTIDLWLHSSGSNIWMATYTLNREDVAQIVSGAGTVGLSGALDRVGFVTTDNFDDGTVTIYYE